MEMKKRHRTTRRKGREGREGGFEGTKGEKLPWIFHFSNTQFVSSYLSPTQTIYMHITPAHQQHRHDVSIGHKGAMEVKPLPEYTGEK